MYSVVLATVLTVGGPSVPAWGLHGCRGGCYGGCTGPVVSSCYGCNGGCTGGCIGGGYGGARAGGAACYGSCGGSCYGVFGCCGGYTACFGGNYGSNAPYYHVYGAYGCGVYFLGCAGDITYKTPPIAGEKKDEKKDDKKDDKKGEKKDKEDAETRATQATVVVQVPEDAKLIVDGVPASLTSDTRTFVTPDLLPGRTYYYMITAEIQREGRTIAHTEKVLVRAGEISRVNFRDMIATSSAQR
jgi:uncharacterized protein (TIGR03000 family)